MSVIPPRLASAIVRVPISLRARLSVAWLRLLGAKIGPGCALKRVMIAQNPWDIELGAGVTLDTNVVLLAIGDKGPHPRICIGRGVYCNRFTMFDATERIEVGEETMIGPGCYITDHDHGFEPGRKVHEQPLISAPTRIGRDCWLGAHVVVLKGVTIGDGAVIATGTVVTKDVPPGSVMAGIPARLQRMR